MVTVSNEIGDWPPISVRDIVAAKKKPIELIDATSLGASGIDLHSFEKPNRERQCRLVVADSAQRGGPLLVETLRADGALPSH